MSDAPMYAPKAKLWLRRAVRLALWGCAAGAALGVLAALVLPALLGGEAEPVAIASVGGVQTIEEVRQPAAPPARPNIYLPDNTPNPAPDQPARHFETYFEGGKAVLRNAQTGGLTTHDPSKAAARIMSGRYTPVTEAEVREYDRQKEAAALKTKKDARLESFALFAGLGALYGGVLLGFIPAAICAWWTFLYVLNEIARALRAP